jgi:hypothetical protein
MQLLRKAGDVNVLELIATCEAVQAWGASARDSVLANQRCHQRFCKQRHSLTAPTPCFTFFHQLNQNDPS